jgi:hypothetical protein
LPTVPNQSGWKGTLREGVSRMTLKSKTLIEEQKRIGEILERFGYAPMDEYEKHDRKVAVTRYEKFGIAVIIERNQ